MKNIRQMFSALADALFPPKPVGVVSVPGFTIEIVRSGLSRLQQIENTVRQKKTPVDSTFYDVTVKATGENPQYPKNDKAFVLRCGYCADKIKSVVGSPLFGEQMMIPAGSRYTAFYVEEEHIKRDPEKPFNFAFRRMGEHHEVTVKICYTDKKGRKNSLTIGSIVRASERKSVVQKLHSTRGVNFV